MNSNALLATLRDVDGVLGAFAMDSSGVVRASDVPAVMGTEALDAVAPRLCRVWDALADGGDGADSASLGYGDHALHVHRTATGLLCIICRADTSPPAIRMAARLVSKRLPAALETQRPEAPETSPPPPPATALAPPPVPSVITSPSAAKPPPLPTAKPITTPKAPAKRPRFFRGRRIDD